jgi:NAD(P)-dependent dehydrogenase (short-subunit alcohol dehydrogenase family)
MLAQEAREGGCRGSIITIASNAAHHGAPEKAVSFCPLEKGYSGHLLPGETKANVASLQPYCASKGALVAMNRALAVVSFGVRLLGLFLQANPLSP